MKSSFLFLAPGFEEIEAMTPVDVLRRAGLQVKTVSVTDDREVQSVHCVPMKADTTIREADFSDADWLILPGGMPGATNLYECEALRDLLKKHAAAGGHIAAICAAPGVVLGQLGLIDGHDVTGYPGFEKLAPRAAFQDERVVVSGNFITANGPSSALLFALAIVRESMGAEAAREIGDGMLLYEHAPSQFF